MFFDWIIWLLLFFIALVITSLLIPDKKIQKIILVPFGGWILFKDLKGNGFGKKRYGLEVRYKTNNKKCMNPIILIIRNLTIRIWLIDLPLFFIDSESRRLGEKITATYVVKI